MGISLINALSGGASALTNAESGAQQGQLQGGQIATQNLLDAMNLYRAQNADALARQEAQARIALEGSQKGEADARARALLAPPAKPREAYVIPGVGLVQQDENGKWVTQVPEPTKPQATSKILSPDFTTLTGGPVVQNGSSFEDLNGKPLKASDVKRYVAPQDSRLVQEGINNANRDLTTAQNNYQAVLKQNPATTHPYASKAPVVGGPMQTQFTNDSTYAADRVKGAWQAAKDAGANPPDIPSLGLTSAPTNPYASTPMKAPQQ